MISKLQINILEVLSRNPYLKNREEICALVGRAPTTVYENLYKLYKLNKGCGVVRKKIEKRKKRGRPKVFWALTFLGFFYFKSLKQTFYLYKE